MNSVECASEADRLTNLAGGFIDVGVVGVGNAVEYEKAGKLKVIGTVASDGIRLEITRKNYRIIIRHYRNRDTRIVQCLYIIIF